ncbi:cell division cycle regulator protein, putative [Ixodes scapularis]|uniref:Cell division cycle regulator protein, putative n=1 Tax=Ixodes scapularis TaxID=6945 RepID=B7QKX3_IXOSC|nr:cell division cycle regulator protein, putative [Ixodes scapularis]|eukprot:XP_002415829.1 cell division cycle regulator protein, putative [Ixodes scapularis]
MKDLRCKFLAVSSRFAGKEYREALEILEAPIPERVVIPDEGDLEQRQLEASLQLLKGKTYEAIDNRMLAAECYKKALRLDIHCYEAFEALVKHQMLSKEEEESLLNLLTMTLTISAEDNEFVRLLYETKVKKYDKPVLPEIPDGLNELRGNLDIATSMAEKCFYNCDYKQCFEITSVVLSKDPYHTDCLPVHISCLLELGKSNALFYLAHKLVDLFPDNAISWFAVGCYYFLVGKADSARRYLSKATVLDQVFGPAWLMYGHSFAVESEHDQAMAAYFKALQLMKGKATVLDQVFGPAWLMYGHSFAVESEHDQAMAAYFKALQLMKGKYNKALEYHQQALVLSPKNASTLSAIGFVHSLMCHWSEAVDYFHKALGLQRDDTFSTTMLSQVIEHLMNELPPYQGVPDVLPEYFSSESQKSSALDMDLTTSQTQEFEMEGNE